MQKIHPVITYLVLILSSGIFVSSCDKGNQDFAGTDVGLGGSLARFTITLNHLYSVDNNKLYTFSLDDPKNPILVNTSEIGSNIETIYTWKDKLFMGSQDAMYIFSIANPAEPSLLGSASHARACDPVVANDSIAYVTVRSGTVCAGNNNALYVYSFRNVLQPIQYNVINLKNPHGLAIQDSTLFVCDSSFGLRVYDISRPYYPIQKNVLAGETFLDCIPHDNLLICMITGGIAIYDIADRDNIVLLAKIKE